MPDRFVIPADPDDAHGRLKERYRAALLELGDRLLNIEDAAEMGYVAAEIAGEALGAGRAGYGTIDAARGTVQVAREWNAPGFISLAGTRRYIDTGAYANRLARGEPILYTDVEREAPPESAAAWLRVGARAVLNLPVFEHGTLVAIVYLHHGAAHPWPPNEIAFLRDLAERTRSAVERRRAESELRQLNQRLEREVAERTADRNRLWQLSTDVMLVAQPDGTITAVNPAWGVILGWSESELLGRSLLDLIHRDDLAATTGMLHRLAGDCPVARCENRCRHRDGSYRWIAWNAVPGGGLVIALGRDFTAERAKTAALVLSEARMRAVFNTSFQMLGLLRTDGTLIDANPTALAAIEQRLEDVVGRPFWETPWFTATPGLPERVQAVIPRVAAGEGAREEITLNLPSGQRAFDFTLRPMFDDAGRVIAIVTEALELTERREAEEQLRQAQKMEAIGQLTGGIAHDFNNLLQGISSALELLQRRITQGRSEDGLRLVDAARDMVSRAGGLTGRLLAFARRQTLAPKIVDPALLAQDMADLIRRTVGPSISLELQASPGAGAVLCDPNQLENALLNLAINARDAMPAGGHLTVATRARHVAAMESPGLDAMPPGDYVELVVTDNGLGMDAATQARAFEPFFTTKPLGSGSGLGLAQIYGFVRQSGGFVWLDSELGLGTTVRLLLPRHADAAPVSASASTAAVADSRPLGGGRRVLLVEDEAAVRKALVEHLTESGYQVATAESGPTALDRLRAGCLLPDVMVTDVGLPGGLDGRQLAEAARLILPDLPVLFITGYAGRTLDAALPPGMEVVAKPFTLHDLSARLHRLVPATAEAAGSRLLD